VEYFAVLLSKTYAEWDCVSDSWETFLCGVECYKVNFVWSSLWSHEP